MEQADRLVELNSAQNPGTTEITEHTET